MRVVHALSWQEVYSPRLEVATFLAVRAGSTSCKELLHVVHWPNVSVNSCTIYPLSLYAQSDTPWLRWLSFVCHVGLLLLRLLLLMLLLLLLLQA